MKRVFFCSVVLIAVLLVAAPLAAQRVTGQIAGVASDESGGLLPGVTASLSGELIVGTRTAVTSDQGFYRFLNLPPGFYDLAFTLDGFVPETQSAVRVSLGKTTTIDVVLKVGGLAEAITVIAESPVVDTVSNEVGVNFGRDWVANAPIARSSFNDLVAAAPGSLQGGEQSARTMVYGSSYDENSFQLDGADVNDNFFNESLAEANPDIIEEVEVLSLGAPAEYRNLTGAVYNVVTRQGTNKFKGDVNYFTQTDGLTETNTGFEDDDGFPYTREEFTEYSVQFGGPIAKDRLWFFASYNDQEDSWRDTGADPAIGPAAVNVDDAERIFVKANLQINPNHSLVFSYNVDEHSERDGIDAQSAPSTAWRRTTETPTPSLGYTAVVSDRTLLDVRATGFRSEVFLGPADPNQPLQEPRFLDLDTYYYYGGHYYFYDLEPTRTTVNAKLSHLADEFLGASHDFRFGVQYNDSSAGGLYGYNDFIYSYSVSYPGYGYGFTRLVPFSYSGNTEALAVFVDDTVRVSDRLTLNLGVRYDENRAYSEAQEELDAQGNPTGVRFPEVEHYTWEYVSPRLGFNYQLTTDGRTVLKGHLGRYHRAIATGEFANVIGPSIKPFFAGGYDTVAREFLFLDQISDNSNLLVDANYESPHTDQFILSVERQLKGNIGLALNLVYKRGSDFAAWRDIGGIYEPVTWIEGDYDLDGVVDPDGDPFATGDALELQRLIGGDQVFIIGNRAEMDNEIKVASLVLNKPMSNNWSLVSSLTYLRSEGRTPDSGVGGGVSGGGTSILQRGGLQFRRFGRNPNDFVNSGGRLRGDIPIQFKTQLVYMLPKGFLVSGNISFRDGANRVRIVRPPRELDLGQRTAILGQERGTFGRLPSQTLVDVRLEKTFSLPNEVEIAVSADIFNLLNEDSYDGVRSDNPFSTNFGAPAAFVLPRRVMLGGKIRF